MGREHDDGVEATHDMPHDGRDVADVAAGGLDAHAQVVLGAAHGDDATGVAVDGDVDDIDDDLDPELRADLAKVRSLAAECDRTAVVPSAKLKGLSRVVESLHRDAFDHPEYGDRIVAAADRLAASVAAARTRVPPPVVSSKQSRNAPCVCGSGRKAKACCS